MRSEDGGELFRQGGRLNYVGTWFPAGYFRRHVLLLLGIGILSLTFATWSYIDTTSFARRALITTGTIEEVLRRPTYGYDGLTGASIHARVRYRADDEEVVRLIRLGYCEGAGQVCFLQKPGDTITVAYDPGHVARAVIAPRGELAAWPLPGLLAGCGFLIGVACLVATVINVVTMRPIRRSERPLSRAGARSAASSRRTAAAAESSMGPLAVEDSAIS
jgi:hypothetical protein